MYLGNQPALAYTSLAKQDFTTSATTSYVLDNPVANANEIALFINFVRQEPTTAYTASGTTLTLTSTTSATDDMYCVFLGKAVQTVNPPAGSVGISQLSATGTKDATTFLRGDNSFATVVSGLTEADQWRLTTTITADTNPISANLERVDDATFAKIGTGVTNTSGIFSFGATGLYKISIFMSGQPTTNDNVAISLYGTSDNGSSFDQLFQNTFGADTNAVISASNSTFFNCTNVSTHKVKFAAESITAGSEISGNTTANNTSFQFIRLGDSQ